MINATFDRFMQLPHELRARIYTLHFDDLKVPLASRQPPITFGSRQTRAETVSLFYLTCQFEVQINEWREPILEYERGRWAHISQNENIVALDRQTAQFFAEIDDADVCRITKLHIGATFASGSKVGWDVDLQLSCNENEAVQYDELTARNMQTYVAGVNDHEDEAEIATNRLRQCVRTILSRPVPHKLQKDDAAVIKSTFEGSRALVTTYRR